MIKYCHYFKELIIYFGNLLIYIRKIKLLGVNIFFSLSGIYGFVLEHTDMCICLHYQTLSFLNAGMFHF